MRKEKKVNKSKFVPIWVPEFIYLSIHREARQERMDTRHLLIKAWCEHVQTRLKQELERDWIRERGFKKRSKT